MSNWVILFLKSSKRRLWPNGQNFCLFSWDRVVMYGSNDSKSRRTPKLHDRFKSYNVFNDVFCPWLMRALLPQKLISSQGRYCPESSFLEISVFVLFFAMVILYVSGFLVIFVRTGFETYVLTFHVWMFPGKSFWTIEFFAHIVILA